MTIDASFQRVLESLRHLNEIGAAPITIQSEYLRLTGASDWSPPDDVSIEDLSIPGPHGQIPLRTYRTNSEARSALLWMHGGGFSYGDLDMPEAHIVGAELASRAGALVVSVDYRLAGDETKFPVPLDDVTAAWTWMVSVAAGDVPVHAIGGASAGGALALAAAVAGRDNGSPAGAVLLAYPFAYYPLPDVRGYDYSEALDALPESIRITSESLEAMMITYVGRATDLPLLSAPGKAHLEGLPPVSILVSEYDDLRSSADQLHDDLRAVGVPVRWHLARGMIHGHLNAAPTVPEVDSSLNFLAGALSTAQRTASI